MNDFREYADLYEREKPVNFRAEELELEQENIKYYLSTIINVLYGDAEFNRDELNDYLFKMSEILDMYKEMKILDLDKINVKKT